MVQEQLYGVVLVSLILVIFITIEVNKNKIYDGQINGMFVASAEFCEESEIDNLRMYFNQE